MRTELDIRKGKQNTMKSTSKIRIVVIDDHPMFRDGVTRTLANQPDLEVVAEGSNAEDAIRYATEFMPEVILMDISMPGCGIKAASVINKTCPVVKIVMLTMSENEDDVMRSMNSGACGYVLKGVGGKQLVEIIHEVHAGQSYVSPGLAARMLTTLRNKPDNNDSEMDLFADLTSREEQILDRLSRGLSNKEIGKELKITEKTVKHYVTNVLQKLQVRNRVEAALLAQKRALEPLESNKGLIH